MAIKLIKACKELNIGMTTLTEWCARNGHPVEYDPNFRLSDELFALLAEEFHRDKEVKINADRALAEAKALEASVSEPSSMPVHQNNDNQRERKQISNNDHRLNSKLKDIPYSYGQVSLFRDREFGIIRGNDGKESFFHPANCAHDEKVEDGDFVLYKASVHPTKGRLTAYLIRHPKEEDGFDFIFDYFWMRDPSNTRIVSIDMVNALIPYSKVHWASEDYARILIDAEPYLVNVKADYSFVSCCETLARIKSLNKATKLPLEFVIALFKEIIPGLAADKIVPTIKAFHLNYSDELWATLKTIGDSSRTGNLIIQSFLSQSPSSDASFIMNEERNGCPDWISLEMRKCFNVLYPNLNNAQKTELYILGYDDSLRLKISDSDIVEYIQDAIENISEYYSKHPQDRAIVIQACCGRLRAYRPYYDNKVQEDMDFIRAKMPELVNDIKQALKLNIDYMYIGLWKDGIVDKPSISEWSAFMNCGANTLGSLQTLYEDSYVDQNEVELIIRQWYAEKQQETENDRKERFAFEHLMYRKFKELTFDFVLPSLSSEYLPLIDWYDTNVLSENPEKEIDFDLVSKHFYLFDEQEQVRILRFLFYLMNENAFEKSPDALKVLTSKAQQELHHDNNIRVCFDIDLIVGALRKFQAKKEFVVEKDILSLMIDSLHDVDLRKREHPLIYQLFDNCHGRTWKKYVDEEDARGRYTGKQVLIERVYSRPHGVIFCEGRKLEKKYEDGLTRYWCRNSYCYKDWIAPHDDWREFTMYDFCRILNFDLRETDYAGYISEYGKYLKFVSLINRFNQFAEHLYCRECGHLMMPSKGMTNLGVTISSYYECGNNDCAQKGNKIYLSHCLNPECQDPIDERDSAKCPNGWVICKTCGTCCSSAERKRRYEFLRQHRPESILDSLRYAVENNVGHMEKEEYYCPKCGTALEAVIGRSDMDHVCTNPNCRETFTLDQWHRKPYNRV